MSEEDRAQVRTHAAMGTPHEVIGELLDYSPKTLRKYFRRELTLSKHQANAEMAGYLFKLFKNGKEGNVIAQKFWLATQAGWKETSVHEMGGIDGGPIPIVITKNQFLY